jgi:hypothetical protein
MALAVVYNLYGNRFALQALSESGNNPMNIEQRFPTFPGPYTLFSSRKKWLRPTLGSALFGTVGIAMILEGAPHGIFVTAVFAIFTLIGVMMLLPGASSLRLDESGFETLKFFFLRKRYSWRDVSDFVVWSMIGKGMVVFKVQKPRLGAYERINAALAGGRNGYLPDTYGMAAGELVQLMVDWRNSAINSIK